MISGNPDETSGDEKQYVVKPSYDDDSAEKTPKLVSWIEESYNEFQVDYNELCADIGDNVKGFAKNLLTSKLDASMFDTKNISKATLAKWLVSACNTMCDAGISLRHACGVHSRLEREKMQDG